MAITQSKLRQAASRYSQYKFSDSLQEAIASQKQTAFLCHSHSDRELALGLQVLLREDGWDVYIDWQDATMPEKPNRETAEKIQAKIRGTDWFLFLATENSTASRWCPWEIGFADRSRSRDRILIVPTAGSPKPYGNEYLELYRRIGPGVNDEQKGYAAFQPGQTKGTWVKNLK